MTALYAVVPDGIAQAADLNQYRDLFRGSHIHDVTNGYGVAGGGSTDDTVAIQAVIDAAGPNGIVQFSALTHKITATLLFDSGVTLRGISGAQSLAGQTKLVASGFAGPILQPRDTSADTVNVCIEDIALDGGSVADTVLDFTRVSYSTLRNVYAAGSKSGAVGILLDAVVSGQCYFNRLEGCKADMTSGTGLRLTRGANVNQVIGGKYGNSSTGVELLSLSNGNVFLGTDFETNSVRHVLVDASSNGFFGVHMEDAPVGFEVTTLGYDTTRIGTTVATSVTEPVVDASHFAGSVMASHDGGDVFRWQVGYMRAYMNWLSTISNLHLEATPYSATRTRLAAAAAAGATSITVDSATGIVDTDVILVDPGTPAMETATVSGAPAGNVITIVSPLAAAHAAGAPVWERGSATSQVSLFRHVNTTGTRQFVVYAGDGTTAFNVSLNANGNVFAAGPLQVLGTSTGYIEMLEMSGAPAAPAANRGRLFLQDNGAGKTQLAVRFPTGAVQIVATEP